MQFLRAVGRGPLAVELLGHGNIILSLLKGLKQEVLLARVRELDD